MNLSKMMRMTVKLIGLILPAVIFCLSIPGISQGQDRCGTVAYTNQLRNKHTLLETNDQFENWLKKKIENRKTTLRTEATTYKIPVVVHVIHKGEPVGTGSNISDLQIQSQIAVLNKDFKRLNTDASSTPAEFQSLAGSMNIEFTLAKRSPEGLATNGIVRVKSTQTSGWTMNDNSTLKSLSYWPAEDYMNIWVVDLLGTLIGYAQFPVSGLPGLENSPNNRLTDGVVIDYLNFGTSDGGAFTLDANYNKGRTATHEIGHFFGLKHIWGDDETLSDQCSGTDYVTDTPNQLTSTSNCPSHPRTTCTTTSMFQNYMDYTWDRCMNLFTIGQINRITSVIENSPRRLSLLSSPGLEDPIPVANDLGIRKIVLPGLSECTGSFIPSIEVKNYGNNTITSAQIVLKRNNVIQETKNFSLNLVALNMATLTFNSQSIPPGTYNFEFEILQTNGVADGRPVDNKEVISTLIPQSISAPFTETFTGTPASWIISNPDQLYTWENKTAPHNTPGNTAMYVNFYNYEDSQGQTDILTTPVFNLSTAQTAYFIFDVAYAQFTGREDALKVYVMNDCQTDVLQGIKKYDKSGVSLATASSTSSAFVPKGEKEWRKEVVDISSFVGENNVQLAFVAVNDWGNNIYIDNVRMVISAKEDVAITEIISPTPVTCEEQIVPRLKVKNLSKIISTNPTFTHTDSMASIINSFKVLYALNGGALQSAGTFTPNFFPGKETEITLPAITFQEGKDSITFKIIEPNGLVDINSSDNEKSMRLIVNKSSDHIPLRQNFDGDFSEQWSLVNPGEGINWATVSTNYNQSIYFNAFRDSIPDEEAWLVSPVLDFSLATNASVFFDLSHMHNTGAGDSVRLLASRDCGNSYSLIKPTLKGETLSAESSTIPWKPSVESDWERKYFNLDTLVGEPAVRLAFVFNSHKPGNNLFIDNIEFFTSNNPTPPSIAARYLIYGTHPFDPGDFYITFKLDERETINYEVIDMLGKTLVQEELVDVLNQTFLVDAGTVGTGIYIVRLRIGGTYYTTKVFLNR